MSEVADEVFIHSVIIDRTVEPPVYSISLVGLNKDQATHVLRSLWDTCYSLSLKQRMQP